MLMAGLISPCANQDFPDAIMQRHHHCILGKTLPKKFAIGLKMFFPPLPEWALVLLLQERYSQIGLQCAHLLMNHGWILLDGLKKLQ